MVAPRENLPSECMPWGRWVTGELDDLSKYSSYVSNDAVNLSSQLKPSYDNISESINGMDLRQSMLLNAPDISGYASGQPNTWVSYGVDYFFNAPYGVNIVANIIVSLTIPGTLITQTQSKPQAILMKLNGTKLNGLIPIEDIQYRENDPIKSVRLSFNGSGWISPGTQNYLRLEIGSYNDTSSDASFSVDASQVELFLTFRSST